MSGICKQKALKYALRVFLFSVTMVLKQTGA